MESQSLISSKSVSEPHLGVDEQLYIDPVSEAVDTTDNASAKQSSFLDHSIGLKEGGVELLRWVQLFCSACLLRCKNVFLTTKAMLAWVS